MDRNEDTPGIGTAFFHDERGAFPNSILENSAEYQIEEVSPETEQACDRLWQLYIALKVTGDYKNVAAYKSVRPVSDLS